MREVGTALLSPRLTMPVSYCGSSFIHNSWPCLIYPPASRYLKRFRSQFLWISVSSLSFLKPAAG